jgi:RNA polymerase sigma-70 factor (ECF subfamily)
VGASAGGVAGVAADAVLVGRLRDGDERAFEEVVADFYPAMFAVARGFVRARSVADEVVQDGWVAVLNGLERFEGRSSLRTWVLQIVANIARDRGVREARSLTFSELDSGDESEPLVEPERFLRAGEPYPGGWKSFPTDWRTLPESQRLVMTLRDVVGCGADEVCEALGISAVNERVLLHRARVRVRAELERYFDG